MPSMDIPRIFASSAAKLIKTRVDALSIHSNDIRAAGNEVEVAVRDYFARTLAPKYYVTHGHVLDALGNCSPQLDIIVSDNLNLPSLLRTGDGTDYVPIDAVYAVGEIKSTFRSSEHPIEGFCSKLRDIRTRLHREDIRNTAYEGVMRDTLLSHAALPRGNRILNYLFSFLVCIDGGDFSPEKHCASLFNADPRMLPNVIVLLNRGVLRYASVREGAFYINSYPEHKTYDEDRWYFGPLAGQEGSSPEGNHLAFLYYLLLQHLINSLLEPPNLYDYMARMFVASMTAQTCLEAS